MRTLLAAAALSAALALGASGAEAHDRSYHRGGVTSGFSLFLGVPTYGPRPLYRHHYWAPPPRHFRHGYWQHRHHWKNRHQWRRHDDRRGGRDRWRRR